MNTLPSKDQLQKAASKKLSDLLDYNLKVLFVGINPGLYTAYTGFPYARPGNRFWPSLYGSGFTPRVFQPSEYREMLKLGYGMTNVVARASNSANELSKEEYIEGGKVLEAKVLKYKPQWVAFVGVQAYRAAFARPKAQVGEQNETLGESKIWVLPSPSGLNAHYRPAEFAAVFREFYERVNE